MFHDSGTTWDGINYVNDYTTTTTYDASRQNYTDGTGHSTSSQVLDASYQDHDDDGLGDTYDDDGAKHSTTTGYNNSGPGIHWGTTTNSHAEDHFTRHGEAGASTLDESGSDFATDQNVSNSYWLDPFTPYSGAADQTHDGGGHQQGSTHTVSDAGDVDDLSYLDEGQDHNESHTAYDTSTGLNTYTASSTSGDDGWDKDDVVAANGDTSGYTQHYQDQSQSTTDPVTGSTSDTSHDDGGTDYKTETLTTADGVTEGGTFSDSFANHWESHVDAAGNYTSSWTSSGSGSDSYYFNDVVGVNYLNVTGHDADSYSASGGTDANGYSYYSGVGEIHGDDAFTVHVEDGLGNTLDETGTDFYQSQSQADDVNGEEDTQSYGGTASYTLTYPDGSTDSGTISYSYPDQNAQYASVSRPAATIQAVQTSQQQQPALQQQGGGQGARQVGRQGQSPVARFGDTGPFYRRPNPRRRPPVTNVSAVELDPSRSPAVQGSIDAASGTMSMSLNPGRVPSAYRPVVQPVPSQQP